MQTSKNVQPAKSEHSCQFCYVKDTSLFREKRYTTCIKCENLSLNYRKYYKEYNKDKFKKDENILLCKICKLDNKICKICVKIQQHVQLLHREKVSPFYFCFHCHVTDKKNFEEHRKSICRACKNKIDYVKTKEERGKPHKITKELLYGTHLELTEKMTKLENENLELKSRLCEIEKLLKNI